MAQIKKIIPPQYFEVIRNRIAEILADELDNQFLLTYDTDFEVDVYIERFVPFDHTDTPAVNVSFSGGSYDNQTAIDVDGSYSYFIDVFTKADTTNDDRGDKLAMFKLHKLLGVCRAIIQNPIYKTLGFEPPFLMSRQISNISIAQPKDSEALSVVMGRLILSIVAPEDTQLLTAKLIKGFDTQVKLSLTDKGYIYSGDNIPVPPVTDGKVTVNFDDFGTVAEGDTLNIPVVNTYDEELGSKIMEKWVIADQRYKDTDDITKTVPAGTLIICTKSGQDDMTANFSADDVTPTLGQIVTFTDSSDKNPTHWLWDFGDGDTSILQNPTHVYTDLGNHTVTLVASNENKQGDTEIKTNYINVGNLPLNAGIELFLNETFTTDANNVISQWNTDVGTDHATEGTASFQPLLIDDYYGNKAVCFNHIMTGAMETPYELIPPYTIFIVCQVLDTNGNNFFLGSPNGNRMLLRYASDGGAPAFRGGYIVVQSGMALSPVLQGTIKKYGLKLVTITLDVPNTANGLKLYIDGVFDVQSNTNANVATPQKTWIGCLDDTSINNRGQDMLETVMVHNTVLTGSNLDDYNNFFMEKHNITP